MWDHFLNFQPEGTNDTDTNMEGTMTDLLQPLKHQLSMSPKEQQSHNKKVKTTEDKQTNDQNKEDDNTQNININITRTPSLDRILIKLPNGVLISNANQGQAENHDG